MKVKRCCKKEKINFVSFGGQMKSFLQITEALSKGVIFNREKVKDWRSDERLS